MPTITRNCSICGKELSILLDEDGEILSEVHVFIPPHSHKEFWECGPCHQLRDEGVSPQAPRPEAAAPQTSEPPPVDPAFGQWLAGWTDAAGRFAIEPCGGGHVFVFRSEAAEADARVLDHLRAGLGFGQVVRRTHRGVAGDAFEVRDPDGVATLICVFERHPLQAPQRALQLAIWTEAFAYAQAHPAPEEADRRRVAAFRRRLLKASQPARPRHSQPDPERAPTLFD